MPRVVFMCGPAGSGKSTVARRLERGGLVRLSIDDEARRRGLAVMPLSDADSKAIERDLRARLVDLIRAGRDVVLDLSFWSRRMRDDYRALVEPTGALVEIVHVQTPRAVALARVSARQGDGAGGFSLDAALAASYCDDFEPPTADEAPLTTVSGTD